MLIQERVVFDRRQLGAEMPPLDECVGIFYTCTNSVPLFLCAAFLILLKLLISLSNLELVIYWHQLCLREMA